MPRSLLKPLWQSQMTATFSFCEGVGVNGGMLHIKLIFDFIKKKTGLTENDFSYFSAKPYDVGTQKKPLNETVL